VRLFPPPRRSAEIRWADDCTAPMHAAMSARPEAIASAGSRASIRLRGVRGAMGVG
jgi:hypothetical protein